MTSLYTENSEKWKSLASVDYFTQFIKAWIPFNAWYKSYYTTLDTDRKAIDWLKTNSNKFRNKLISLLKDQGNDGISFRSRIAELHVELERKHIFNKGERITFEDISIESNPTLAHSLTYNGCEYKVQKGIPNRSGEIDIFIYGKSGGIKFKYTQTQSFNIYELTCNLDFLKLSATQQTTLKTCYEQINPSKRINLLIRDPDIIKRVKDRSDKQSKTGQSRTEEWIEVSNLLFVNDPDKICKGIIEILYNLRNVLFHGEIVPDNDTNKVYEPAYQILHTLIQAL